jgi:hypothetical protein
MGLTATFSSTKFNSFTLSVLCPRFHLLFNINIGRILSQEIKKFLISLWAFSNTIKIDYLLFIRVGINYPHDAMYRLSTVLQGKWNGVFMVMKWL